MAANGDIKKPEDASGKNEDWNSIWLLNKAEFGFVIQLQNAT
jgi:hypothetical protein